jgi:DHA1 family bicyclomycin/chloramphenicol resistance-like MFS transporter
MKLITIIIICILAGAEVDLFIPSFPELQQLFHLSPFMVQLTLSVNFCAYCIGSFISGSLGDKYNRKIVILGGLTIFTLGSIACIFATNFSWLVLGRFLQGCGIAGPAILTYVIIADEYSVSQQHKLMGMVNGIVTLAMSFAPIIGSYVTLFFKWQGNFILLFAISLLALFMGYYFIPANKHVKAEGENLPSYLSLLKSPKLLAYMMAICFLIVPYWTFIGMAPILYMQDLGVDLSEFGYYQGTLAITFSVVSITSGASLKRFGTANCFYAGCALFLISGFLILITGLSGSNNPLIITGSMLLFSAGAVFPINILYPISLNVIPHAKGRIAAIIMAVRLIFTAIALELVSYYYQGNFLIISLVMCICIIITISLILVILKKKWMELE